ncbi:MAG: chromosome partitioning protein ParA, partial [Pedobacter sp.]
MLRSATFVKVYFLLLFTFTLLNFAAGQEIVEIKDNIKEHFFTFKQIEQLRDDTGILKFDEVRSPKYSNGFAPSNKIIPLTTDLNSTNWFRIRIKNNEQAKTKFLLEFFDQTIDHITAYIPQKDGTYAVQELGDRLKFEERNLHHKNFEILLSNDSDQVLTYYFKIRSSQSSAAIIVLRSVPWFISYALDEYFYFGIFYGMILVFSFYNLMMFIAMRERQYLYYVLYMLSVALFEMSSDGVAYQYLWPNSIGWNQVSFSFALCAISVFALLFSKEFLIVRKIAPKLNKLITIVVIVRIAFLVVSLLFFRDLLTYKFIEFVPLAVAFYTG